MKRNVTKLILAAVAAVTIIAGCEKQLEYGGDETGSPIQFGASTEWLNDIETRTEYSGVDENGRAITSSSNYERIDWVEGKDVIRVLCDAADGKETASKKTADYIISSVRVPSDKKKSQASITSGDSNALHWGTGTHYFYALYPAPGMESNYSFSSGNPVSEANSKIESVTGNKAKITGVIPASQQAVKQGNVFKPNMNYAYMYARAQGTPGVTTRVDLEFYPLVTSFEIRLKGISSDLISSKLTSLKLSSATTALTGTFTATLSATGNPSIATSGTTGKEITITLPNGGTTLSATEAQTFTFLALPVQQTDLTLTLYFANGTTRKLALKKNGSFITVAACKKVYFDNLGVPNSMYYFDVVGPTASIGPEGGNRGYTVKSYVNRNGSNSIVSWTAQFSTDDGATWSNSKPSWLTGFTSSDTGALTDKRYTATASVNDTYTNKTWKGSSLISLGNNSKANAIDLSLRDVKGNTISRSTANCYVVNSPGWYKIPLVYGNAIKNGATNTVAYSNSNSATYALKNFVRHDGQPITNPWIRENDINVTSAEMMWQDNQWVISTTGDPNIANANPPSIDGDYLYFYVNEGFVTGSASRPQTGNLYDTRILSAALSYRWYTSNAYAPLGPYVGAGVYASRLGLTPRAEQVLRNWLTDSTFNRYGIQIETGRNYMLANKVLLNIGLRYSFTIANPFSYDDWGIVPTEQDRIRHKQINALRQVNADLWMAQLVIVNVGLGFMPF